MRRSHGGKQEVSTSFSAQEKQLLDKVSVVSDRFCILFDNVPTKEIVFKIMVASHSGTLQINDTPPDGPAFYPCEVYVVDKTVEYNSLSNDNMRPWNIKRKIDDQLAVKSKSKSYYFAKDDTDKFIEVEKDKSLLTMKTNFYVLPRCKALRKRIYRLVMTKEPDVNIGPSVIIYSFDGTEPTPKIVQNSKANVLSSDVKSELLKNLEHYKPEDALKNVELIFQESGENIPTLKQAQYMARRVKSGNRRKRIKLEETISSEEMIDESIIEENIIENDIDFQMIMQSDQPSTSNFYYSKHDTIQSSKMFSSGVLASSFVPQPDVDSIITIADIPENANIDSNERDLRNKLASLYRLVDLFKWSQSIYNHITVRISETSDEILINPFGLFYNEVTAHSLVKVNIEGDVIDNGSTNYGINQAGYVLHSAIHNGRPDAKCIVHLHHPSVVAVSIMKCGLLPISQEAMIIGQVSYHDYCGILVDEEERESLVQDLGNNNVMILRNHGFVVCGSSIEHALSLTYHLIIACETQVKCVPNGITDHIHIPSDKAIAQVYSVASKGGGGVNRKNGEKQSGNWKQGELEWQAYMRSLDRAGYQTGHQYK